MKYEFDACNLRTLTQKKKEKKREKEKKRSYRISEKSLSWARFDLRLWWEVCMDFYALAGITQINDASTRSFNGLLLYNTVTPHLLGVSSSFAKSSSNRIFQC